MCHLKNGIFVLPNFNLADFITRLEKSVDLTKISFWCRSPHFLLKKTSCKNIDDCENKETFPEALTQDFESKIKKNVLITSNKIEHPLPGAVDNIIKASNYSHNSSIVNEPITTISSHFIYLFIYFYEKILSVRKAPKPKTNYFHLLGSFCASKNRFLCCFSFAFLVFVGWFWLICVFVRSKSFRKKN